MKCFRIIIIKKKINVMKIDETKGLLFIYRKRKRGRENEIGKNFSKMYSTKKSIRAIFHKNSIRKLKKEKNPLLDSIGLYSD